MAISHFSFCHSSGDLKRILLKGIGSFQYTKISRDWSLRRGIGHIVSGVSTCDKREPYSKMCLSNDYSAFISLSFSSTISYMVTQHKQMVVDIACLLARIFIC